MTDSTRTRVQLRVSVASKLGILNAGNTVNADDAKIIDRSMDDKLRELENKGLINFDIEGNDIEVNLFNPLTFLIANELTEDFAVDTEMTARINTKAKDAMMEITEQAFEGAINTPTKIDYF